VPDIFENQTLVVMLDALWMGFAAKELSKERFR
jgi:hypothetical protein